MLTFFSLEEAPITVTASSENRRFFIHSLILAKSSAFFEAAVKREWKEGQQHEIRLPEDDATTFKTYAEWLYTGTVGVNIAATSETYVELAKLYVLGEKLIDAPFQDEVINAIVASSRKADHNGIRHPPSLLSISIIYRDTPPDSPARRLMADFYAFHGKPTWIAEDPVFYDKEFLIDLSKALLNCKLNVHDAQKAKNGLDLGIPCAYHKHDKESPCGKDVMQKFLKD